MFFSIRTVALAASLAAGFANGAVMPREESEAALDPGAFVHFFVCTDINFGGLCQNLGTNTGVCNGLGSPFFQSISSAGPDAGVTCTLFAGSTCTGDSQSLTNPGSSDLRQGNFNDRAISYRCN